MRHMTVGIGVYLDSGVPGKLTVADSVVTGNHGSGIWAEGSTATVERTLVADTREHEYVVPPGSPPGTKPSSGPGRRHAR